MADDDCTNSSLNPHYRNIWFDEHWLPEFVTYAATVMDQQYAAAMRTYNTDALERSSNPPQARPQDKELTGFAALNSKKRSRPTNLQDEPAKYKNIEDPLESQDPLDW
jgi:hypothetical protein